jgi:hypothetical protein
MNCSSAGVRETLRLVRCMGILLHSADHWHNVPFRDHETEGRKPPSDSGRRPLAEHAPPGSFSALKLVHLSLPRKPCLLGFSSEFVERRRQQRPKVKKVRLPTLRCADIRCGHTVAPARGNPAGNQRRTPADPHHPHPRRRDGEDICGCRESVGAAASSSPVRDWQLPTACRKRHNLQFKAGT